MSPQRQQDGDEETGARDHGEGAEHVQEQERAVTHAGYGTPSHIDLSPPAL
jgi:hypothetical protein